MPLLSPLFAAKPIRGLSDDAFGMTGAELTFGNCGLAFGGSRKAAGPPVMGPLIGPGAIGPPIFKPPPTAPFVMGPVAPD